MRLTREERAYQGFHGIDGLTHVRVHEEQGRVLVDRRTARGQPRDAPDDGIEMVAVSIRENLFADGREFRLVSYEPRDTLGNSWFRLVELSTAGLARILTTPAHYTGIVLFVDDRGERLEADRGTEKNGDFRDPRWYPLDDPAELGCEVQTWPRGEYTVAALFGRDGETMRAEFAANTRASGDRLSKLLEG